MTEHTEIERLYAVADDHEADVLDELRERAGIVWTCRSRAHGHGWTNMTGEPCELCGATQEETAEAVAPTGRDPRRASR